MRTMLLMVLLWTSSVSVAAERSSWSFSKNQDLYELAYGQPETDADIYMRCEQNSGWIFVFYHIGTRDDRQMKLSAAEAKILPSYRVHYDGEVMEGFYVDMAVPANHSVMNALASGHALRFNRTAQFPVRSSTERREIRKFIAACDVEKPANQ